MEEDAILKLRIIKGTNLAVRDWRGTSDPYVVVRLGRQKVKTGVIRKSLNPVWNEDLTLFVPKSQPLILEVASATFDKDWFSRDDPIGNGEVDLANLASAARMLKVARKLKTSLPPSLKREKKQSSWCIRCVDGPHMVQEVCLNLQKVESGQLELHVKWVDGTF